MISLRKIEDYTFRKITKSLFALECSESRDGNVIKITYHAALLQQNRNEVNIKSTISTSSVNDLVTWIKNNQTPITPCIVSINSDKIIHKIFSPADSNRDYIKDLVPNSPKEEFYLQKQIQHDNSVIVSIVRKTTVSSILQPLEPIKGMIVKISVGPFSVFTIHHLLDKAVRTGNTIQFENFSFTTSELAFTNFSISAYGTRDDAISVTVGNEVIPSTLLIAYSCGLTFLISATSYPSLINHEIIKNYENYVFNTTSKRVALFYGITLLGFLVVSSYFFNSYRIKSNILQREISHLESKLESQRSLISQRKNEDEVNEKNGIFRSSCVSLYADAITSTLPESTYITKLNIHPPNNKHNMDGNNFDYGKILVQGTTFSDLAVTNWVSLIKQNKWVQSVLIKEYQQSTNSGLSSFSIEVSKKHS